MKKILFTLSMFLVLVTAAPASAYIVYGFEAEIHTGNYYFAIHNASDPGVLVSQVYVKLGDNMQFDTALGSPAFDPLDKLLADSAGLTKSNFSSGPWTTVAGPSVGYAGPLSNQVTDGGTSATFTFDRTLNGGFQSGEAWGFYVDFDSLSGNPAAGSVMNNALITVTYTDSAGNFAQTLSFQYGTFSGGKNSFPTAAYTVDNIHYGVYSPEPVTMLLFGSGLIGVGAVVRRRFRK